MRRVGEALVKDSQMQLMKHLMLIMRNGVYLRIEALVKDSQMQLMPIAGFEGVL